MTKLEPPDVDREERIGDRYTPLFTDTTAPASGGVWELITRPACLLPGRDYTPAQARAISEHLKGTYVACRVPGCGRRVEGWSALCNAHRAHRRAWGHELVRHPQRRDVTRATRRVAAFLAPYRVAGEAFRHPALVRIVSVLDHWMLVSSWDTAAPGAATVARMAAAGVRGCDLLVPLVAGWLMARDEPHRFPDSRVLSCLVATLMRRCAAQRASGRLAVEIRKHAHRDTLAIGEYVRGALAAELNRAVDGIHHAEAERRREEGLTEHASPTVARFTPPDADVPRPSPVFGMVGVQRRQHVAVHDQRAREYVQELEAEIDRLRALLPPGADGLRQNI